MERGRLAIACLPGIANPRNAWRGTFRGKYLMIVILLALLFSLPNLVIVIVPMMILISALLEMLRMLASWQPRKQQDKLMQKVPAE